MNLRTLAPLAILSAGIFGANQASAQQGVVALPAAVVAPVVAPVAAVRQSESEVRQMPLEQRPNRLGHFYGNTIRRRQAGTLFVNRHHSERPLARYFYIAR